MCTKKFEGFLPIMTMRTITHITPRIIIICSQWIFRKSLEKQSNLTTTTVIVKQLLKSTRITPKFPISHPYCYSFFFFIRLQTGTSKAAFIHTQVFALQVITSACPHLGILPPVFILQFCK